MKFLSPFVFLMLFFVNQSMAQEKEISYREGTASLKGIFVPAKSNVTGGPGVVVLPAWMGIDEHSKNTAKALSELGYHAFVADVYGGDKPASPQEAGKQAGYYKTNYEKYQARIKAAIDQLLKQGADPQKIAVIGFCFGGTGALEAARAGFPIAGVVSFHGGLGKDSSRANGPITAKVLVLHGADDPFVPKAEIESLVQEMNAGKADWQMVWYADAVHAFTDPGAGQNKAAGAAYNEKAARRSWEHMKLFFDEIFGQNDKRKSAFKPHM
jgi:dienelactone hydrolase